MGKTIRFEENQRSSNQEVEQRSSKKKKSMQENKGELSSKLRHGHFTQMHVWPVTNTKRKGRHRI